MSDDIFELQSKIHVSHLPKKKDFNKKYSNTPEEGSLP